MELTSKRLVTRFSRDNFAPFSIIINYLRLAALCDSILCDIDQRSVCAVRARLQFPPLFFSPSKKGCGVARVCGCVSQYRGHCTACSDASYQSLSWHGIIEQMMMMVVVVMRAYAPHLSTKGRYNINFHSSLDTK
jgi:hypothetical protein